MGWVILAPDAEPVIGSDLDTFILEKGELGHAWPIAVGFEALLWPERWPSTPSDRPAPPSRAPHDEKGAAELRREGGYSVRD